MLLALIVFMITVSAEQRKKATLAGVDVFFRDDIQFIPKATIENIVYNSIRNFKKCKPDTLNTERIETRIEKLPWVKKAEVFVGYQRMDSKFFTARLKVWVRQREPLFRVMLADGGYYVDTEGKKVPFSSVGTAGVVVCTGYITNEMITGDLMKFINYINEKPFWKAQIEQIYVKRNGELILVPRLGGHVIELGKVEKLDLKFGNLMALYEQGFKDGGWEKYRKVSLKFDNQVVCTRR